MRKNIFILLFFSILLFSCDHNIDVISSDEVEEQEDVIEDDVIQSEEKETEVKEQKENKQKRTERLNQLTVHYIDVGQGDSALLEFSDVKEQYTILYDVGDWQGNEVVSYLQNEKVSFIDLIIISHPHADHIGQLEKVINAFNVGEVWMSGNSANTTLFQSAMEAVLDSDADYDEPTAGDVFDIGPLELQVLHPENLTGGLNEDSLAIHFTYGNISFLFTGDAYAKQERLMLQRTEKIQADFLQLGHHGSNTSSDPLFIDAVKPKYAIYSAGEGNSYGHPHEEIVSLFKGKDIPLYGTDVNGTIIVTTDGIQSEITTEKPGKANGHQDTEKSVKKEAPPQKKGKRSKCINVNKASKDELQHIIHIGEARAEELTRLRPFESVDDLTRINGIGPARLADIKKEGKACVEGGK